MLYILDTSQMMHSGHVIHMVVQQPYSSKQNKWRNWDSVSLHHHMHELYVTILAFSIIMCTSVFQVFDRKLLFYKIVREIWNKILFKLNVTKLQVPVCLSLVFRVWLLLHDFLVESRERSGWNICLAAIRYHWTIVYWPTLFAMPHTIHKVQNEPWNKHETIVEHSLPPLCKSFNRQIRLKDMELMQNIAPISYKCDVDLDGTVLELARNTLTKYGARLQVWSNIKTRRSVWINKWSGQTIVHAFLIYCG